MRLRLERHELAGLNPERRKPERVPAVNAEGLPPSLVAADHLGERHELRIGQERWVPGVGPGLPAVVPAVEDLELGRHVVRQQSLSEPLELAVRQPGPKTRIQARMPEANEGVEIVEDGLQIHAGHSE